MIKTLLYLFALNTLSLQSTDSSTLHPSFVGKQMQVLTDKISRVKGEHHLEDCYYFRNYEVKFEYAGDEHPFIFYFIY